MCTIISKNCGWEKCLPQLLQCNIGAGGLYVALVSGAITIVPICLQAIQLICGCARSKLVWNSSRKPAASFSFSIIFMFFSWVLWFSNCFFSFSDFSARVL
ncbi:hypothetical protein BDC45DRAFT_505586 [Circinella umbellata]|nr:hypothetical protein BDC45DRAFT_505586 [Circinella umbellata]